MLLKTIIVVLFIAVVISLFSGLRFLVKDLGNSKRRLLFALGLRIYACRSVDCDDFLRRLHRSA